MFDANSMPGFRGATEINTNIAKSSNYLVKCKISLFFHINKKVKATNNALEYRLILRLFHHKLKNSDSHKSIDKADDTERVLTEER